MLEDGFKNQIANLKEIENPMILEVSYGVISNSSLSNPCELLPNFDAC